MRRGRNLTVFHASYVDPYPLSSNAPALSRTLTRLRLHLPAYPLKLKLNRPERCTAILRLFPSCHTSPALPADHAPG